jgi:hypothetical protein
LKKKKNHVVRPSSIKLFCSRTDTVLRADLIARRAGRRDFLRTDTAEGVARTGKPSKASLWEGWDANSWCTGTARLLVGWWRGNKVK